MPTDPITTRPYVTAHHAARDAARTGEPDEADTYELTPDALAALTQNAPDDAAQIVGAFNRDHPIGTPVQYWTGTREGHGKHSTTRSEAQMLGGHTPVVRVTGEASFIALTHVAVVAASVPGAAARTTPDLADEQAVRQIVSPGRMVAEPTPEQLLTTLRRLTQAARTEARRFAGTSSPYGFGPARAAEAYNIALDLAEQLYTVMGRELAATAAERADAITMVEQLTGITEPAVDEQAQDGDRG